jgi:biotin-(acetyl-CoA carboxylase) ligase
LVAIVGVGVNVAAVPPNVPHATCLGGSVDRGTLLVAFIHQLETLRAQPPELLHQEWERRLWRRNQRVHLLDLSTEQDVVILGANFDGSLRVRTADGAERVTMTGELLA